MKKGFKILSLLALSTFGLTTSGCAISKNKINEITEKVSETEFDYTKSFELTWVEKSTQKIDEDKTSVEVVTVTYAYDEETDAFKFTILQEEGIEGEDLEKVTEHTDKIFKEDDIVYSQYADNKKFATAYATTAEAFENSFELFARGKFAADYYSVLMTAYNNYTDVVYYGCSVAEDKSEKNELLEKVPGLLQTEKSSLTCDAKRKLFSKTKVFELSYRVNASKLRDVTIKTDGDGRITYAKTDDVITTGTSSKLKYVTTEIKIKY